MKRTAQRGEDEKGAKRLWFSGFASKLRGVGELSKPEKKCIEGKGCKGARTMLRPPPRPVRKNRENSKVRNRLGKKALKEAIREQKAETPETDMGGRHQKGRTTKVRASGWCQVSKKKKRNDEGRA